MWAEDVEMSARMTARPGLVEASEVIAVSIQPSSAIRYAKSGFEVYQRRISSSHDMKAIMTQHLARCLETVSPEITRMIICATEYCGFWRMNSRESVNDIRGMNLSHE